MKICWWILFGLNFIFYGVTCVMIIKRKTFTSISIRSPTLSLMTNLGIFFLSQIIVLYQIFDKNFISFFYFLFRVMMFVSLILKYERILRCCMIYKNSEKEDELYFSKKRYLYQEKYYFRILIICLLFIAILLVLFYLIKIDNVEVLFRFNLIYDFKDKSDSSKNTIYKMNLIVIICWSFVEQFIFISYIFRTLSKYIKEKIKLEILVNFIIWYIYAFICNVFNLYSKNDSLKKESNLNIFLSLFSLLVHYSLLFFNGIFPLILSYHYRTSISYHFSPKLMGNLFLFLVNEECYNTFFDYLKKKNDIRGLFYLKLYTHIMKYKLNFSGNVDDKTEARNDLNEIYLLFFADDYCQNYIDKAIVVKIRDEYKGLEDRIIPEIFDRALKVAFVELGKIFDVFHKEDEYNALYCKIKINSYIHCKMCNTGLINQM